MLKILQLCAVDFTAYHLLRPLGVGLREAGYDVTFCCSPGEGLDLLRDEGFGVEAIPISRNYNVAHHARSFAALVAFHEQGEVLDRSCAHARRGAHREGGGETRRRAGNRLHGARILFSRRNEPAGPRLLRGPRAVRPRPSPTSSSCRARRIGRRRSG